MRVRLERRGCVVERVAARPRAYVMAPLLGFSVLAVLAFFAQPLLGAMLVGLALVGWALYAAHVVLTVFNKGLEWLRN